VTVEADPTNVAGLLRRQAAERPDVTALVDGLLRLSWRDVEETVDRLANGLVGLGLVAGNRVMLAATNRVELVTTYLAVLRTGLVAVPLDPTARAHDVARVVHDCGARVCLADATALPAVREGIAAAGANVLTIVVDPAGELGEVRDGEVGYGDLPRAGDRARSPLDPESLAVLAYTSGTTGPPRGAMLSHRALLANIAQGTATTPPPMRSGDVVLGLVPMCHLYALNAVLGQVLLTGARLVLAGRLDADETLALVVDEQVTCLPLTPQVISLWLQLPRPDELASQLASVRTILCGGAPLGDDLAGEFQRRTGLSVEQGYGLTEAGPGVASTLGTTTRKPGSVGRALPGVELEIVDEAGRSVVPGDPGEIRVRGANLFSGYWPDRAADPGADGWLRTGDVGFLDSDGDLFLVDRVEEVVTVAGFSVYPSEIEDVIGEVAGVAECAVIGTADAETGAAMAAYVVPWAAPGDADAEALRAAVLQHCTYRLARFKVPARVVVVRSLPYSATGKVAKARLRADPSATTWGGA
jgi:long-chain acyl-CoA synthetase